MRHDVGAACGAGGAAERPFQVHVEGLAGDEEQHDLRAGGGESASADKRLERLSRRAGGGVQSEGGGAELSKERLERGGRRDDEGGADGRVDGAAQ